MDFYTFAKAASRIPSAYSAPVLPKDAGMTGCDIYLIK